MTAVASGLRKRSVKPEHSTEARYAASSLLDGDDKRPPRGQGWSLAALERQASSAMASFVLAFDYVLASIRKDRRSFWIGVSTVAMVVGFITVLQSAIQYAPLLFLRIAETEVGENDILLQPLLNGGTAGAADGAGISAFLLNETQTSELLEGNPDIRGTAPRWAVLGDVFNNENLARNASCFVLVIDSQKEESIGLGRKWNRRRLGEQETYVTSQLLREVGVRANFGERVRLRIDLVAQVSLLAGIDTPEQEQAFTRQLLEDAGVDFSQPVETDIGGTVIGGVTVPAGTIVTVDPDAAFEAVYPALRDALVLDQEYIVLDGIEDPAGKYPKSLGNVVILEKEFVELLIAETIEGFVAANGPALTAAGVDPDSLQPLSQFFRDGRMDEGALQVALMVTDRKELYEGDAEEVKRRMIIKSDSAFADLGADYSASVLFPVVSVLQASQFVSLFLSLIFTGVVFLLALLGVMVIYSLMLGDVESKTYEYGMLRALGMRHRTLSSLLLTQAAFFSGPGIVIGFAAASLLNVGVVLGLGALADVTVPWLLHPAAWALGSVLGTAIPAVANIVPIQRALSRTLRDALDLYRQTTGEITVQVMRLEKLGLSPLQTASSLALVVVGFTTYYVLPLSFVFRDLTLFLSVLNAILLCMLAGLAIMAVTVQPALERVLLWSSLWGRERKLGGIVSKNLAGHRPRNRKTATMITLTVAFLIFAGSLLALQARSISETLESFIGSDVAVRANSWTLQLPQQPLEAYLERYREGAQGVPEEFAVVRDYTWVSFPLSRTPGFTSTRLTNLARFPRPRSTVYGVERNYVEAAYDQFVVITENAPRYSAADVGGSGGDTGVVQRMHDNAGSLTLPIEKGGISIPPQVATGIRLDESSTVEYGSGEDREEEEEEVEAAEEAADAGIDSIETLEGRYRNYLDCIVSESVRLYSSVDTAVPLLSDARTERVEGRSARQYLLAKAHAMASKMPGFGFSAYTPFAFGAPMLVPMAQVAEVVNRVYNTLNLDGQGQPREEEAAAAPTNGTAADNSTASTNGTAPANGTATLPVQFTSETLPKGTLLVRFRPGVTEDGRLRFVNGLRGVLRNDLITVDDAAELTESSQNAAFALNLFFFVVALVALVLCFFASWLSFAANIRDNSREFGILRALGLSVNQVLRCYLYEAGAVVGAAFILGTIVGILVAVSLTLQFNLFVEMPFSFSFPGLMFGINAGGCVGVALLSSYLPAKPLMRAQIARVVKGTAL